MIIADPFLSAKAISEKISEKTSEKIRVTARTIESDLAQLKKLGVLTREGGRKEVSIPNKTYFVYCRSIVPLSAQNTFYYVQSK